MEFTIIHEYTPKKHLVKLTIKQLLELPIENWKHNRPPDEIRVAEIEDYILDQDNQILQPFYIHYNSKIDVYEMLDGIHRYSAIKNIKDCPSIYEKVVFVHLFTDLTYGNLIDIFQNLNKTIPVPELYMNPDQDNTSEKEIIEEVVAIWKKKYKSHFSSLKTTYSNIPNINSDTFKDMLSELYKYKKVRSKEKLLELIEKANANIKEYIISGANHKEISEKTLSNKQLQKCAITGCYLFLCRDIRSIKSFIG